jgi:hypothetical protein
MAQAVPTLLLVGLAVPLAACGGSESSGDPSSTIATTVAGAVEETFDAGTARFTLTFEHTRSERSFGVDAGERDSVEGAVDFDRHRVEVGTDHDQFIVDEAAFYFRAPEEDTRWRRYAFDPQGGGAIAPDVTLGRLDPVRLLEFLPSIESTFGVVGEEDVGGTPTTRYAGFGEAEPLMRALLSESVYAQLPWETHSTSVQHNESVPFDVWVGEDGRVHKVILDFPDFSSYAGDLTTVELHDFGADVDIELPLPSETIDG